MDDMDPLLDEEDTKSLSVDDKSLICQACLSTKACTRLANQTSLMLYKASVFMDGQPPQVLCVLCVATLRRFRRFLDVCHQSREQLDSANKFEEPITFINSINNGGCGLIHTLSIVNDIAVVDVESTSDDVLDNEFEVKLENYVIKIEPNIIVIDNDNGDNDNEDNDNDNEDNDNEDNDNGDNFNDNNDTVKLSTGVCVEQLAEVNVQSLEELKFDDYEDKDICRRSKPSPKNTDDEQIKNSSSPAGDDSSDDEPLLNMNTGSGDIRKADTYPPNPKTRAKPKNKKKQPPPRTDNDKPIRIAKPVRSTYASLFKKCFESKLLSKSEQRTQWELRRISENYTKTPMKCHDCFKGFRDRVAYDLHMKTHMDIENGIKCEICKKSFKTRRSLQFHSYRHEETYNCTKCEFTTNTRNAALNHLKWHEGKEYRCKQCPLVFNHRTSYLSHKRIKHPSDNFVCTHCGFSFVGDSGLKQHLLRSHPDVPEVQMNGPICPECDIRFVNQHALDTHRKVSPKHTDTVKINDICSERLRKETKRKKRISTETKTSEAKANEQESTTEMGDVDKARNLEDLLTLSCDKCGYMVASEHGHRMHVKALHPEHVPIDVYNMLCELCGKTYKNSRNFVDHMNEHNGIAKHVCNVCGDKFTRRENLNNHKKKHNGARYSCPLCEKTFSSKRNRDRHYTYVHNGVTDVKCNYCDKLFKSTANRKLHIDHCHYKKPYPKRVRVRQKTAPAASKRDGG